MLPLQIRSPIWGGKNKTRAVGISENKIGQTGIDLEILYKDKSGRRIYPHVYTVSRERINKCQVKLINGVIKLRIVPIDDLEVKLFRYAN